MMVGSLRHSIKFIELGSTQDSSGQPLKPETIFNTVKASASSASGTLSYKDAQLFPEATEVFTLRYFAGVTMDMIIGFGSRRFHIVNISNDEERNISLTIIAKEIINGN